MNTQILSFCFSPKRKMGIGIAVFVAGLLGTDLLIPDNVLMALQENESIKTPSYAGFADIQATKNHFILTQLPHFVE